MAANDSLTPEQVARQVSYWLDLADYDMETARAMLTSRRLLYVAFMCHQVVEKSLKAAYTDRCQAVAPKIHRLVALAQKSGILGEMALAQQGFLKDLDPMNVESRYPAENEKLLAALTVPECELMVIQTSEILEWIKRKLSGAPGSMPL